MVDIPHIRLVVDNVSRKPDPSGRTSSPRARSGKEAELRAGHGDLVSLVVKENQRAQATAVPTARQAQEALEQVRQALPQYDKDLGEVHGNLDRRHILQLLAPLVEN